MASRRPAALVFELAHELAPTLVENGGIQAGLLRHVLSRLLGGAPGAGGHAGDLEILDREDIRPLHHPRGDLVNGILALARDMGVQFRQLAPGSLQRHRCCETAQRGARCPTVGLAHRLFLAGDGALELRHASLHLRGQGDLAEDIAIAGHEGICHVAVDGHHPQIREGSRIDAAEALCALGDDLALRRAAAFRLRLALVPVGQPFRVPRVGFLLRGRLAGLRAQCRISLDHPFDTGQPVGGRSDILAADLGRDAGVEPVAGPLDGAGLHLALDGLVHDDLDGSVVRPGHAELRRVKVSGLEPRATAGDDPTCRNHLPGDLADGELIALRKSERLGVRLATPGGRFVLARQVSGYTFVKIADGGLQGLRGAVLQERPDLLERGQSVELVVLRQRRYFAILVPRAGRNVGLSPVQSPVVNQTAASRDLAESRDLRRRRRDGHPVGLHDDLWPEHAMDIGRAQGSRNEDHQKNLQA